LNITEQDIVEHRKSGTWRKLEQLAKDVIGDAEQRAGSELHAVLGGGTRVMLALNHRISNDIDLFIRDPQWLGYLSPGLSSKFESVVPDYEEGPTSLKLKRPEGEIDFIVARSLLDLPTEAAPDTSFALEAIAEVLAKKLFYRGNLLKPRDLFDWWVIETRSPNAIPVQELATLLVPKYAAIENALNAMPLSPVAAEYWEAVQAPNKPDLGQTARWAKDRLSQYRALARRS
jgi:hypothetical protein